MTSDSDRQESDLEAFKPSPPSRKIDDKAAKLELEVQALKAQFNRERVTYSFIIGLIFNIYVMEASESRGPMLVSVIGTLILLYSMARWLDHPWLGDSLARWNDLIYKYFERRMLGKQDEKTEPLDGNTD